MRKPTTGNYATKEELVEAIALYVGQSMTWRLIARKVGVSDTTAMKLWKERQDAGVAKQQLAHMLSLKPDPLPAHHVQWHKTMIKAAKNDHLALMACRDNATGENRSVICLVNYVDDEISFVPLGHLATTDNPYDAYTPPNPDQETVQ